MLNYSLKCMLSHDSAMLNLLSSLNPPPWAVFLDNGKFWHSVVAYPPKYKYVLITLFGHVSFKGGTTKPIL